ncbi:MAG: hypothetical protein KC493_07455 [Bacteriovoracaceae bacterium]|nr:hypothetical protein [Bacteriovoracaceae bacterium]
MKKNNESMSLESNLKKQILDKIVGELSKSDPNLYYVNSNSISHLIKEYIQERKLKEEDYERVKDLSPSDILILMSYKSSCC